MSEEDEQHAQRMRELKAKQDAERRTKEIKRGVVIINTGDGKGKSTSAFGVALRAAGHGQRVGLVQFIKGSWKTGEQEALKRFPEIEHVVSGEGFTWETQNRRQDIASARTGFETAQQFVSGGEHDVVILDEINIVLSCEYLPVQDVVALVSNKPQHVSVLLTGRGAPQELIDVADTVTEMRAIKHAYEAGIRARKGIEF